MRRTLEFIAALIWRLMSMTLVIAGSLLAIWSIQLQLHDIFVKSGVVVLALGLINILIGEALYPRTPTKSPCGSLRAA